MNGFNEMILSQKFWAELTAMKNIAYAEQAACPDMKLKWESLE